MAAPLGPSARGTRGQRGRLAREGLGLDHTSSRVQGQGFERAPGLFHPPSATCPQRFDIGKTDTQRRAVEKPAPQTQSEKKIRLVGYRQAVFLQMRPEP